MLLVPFQRAHIPSISVLLFYACFMHAQACIDRTQARTQRRIRPQIGIFRGRIFMIICFYVRECFSPSLSPMEMEMETATEKKVRNSRLFPCTLATFKIVSAGAHYTMLQNDVQVHFLPYLRHRIRVSLG